MALRKVLSWVKAFSPKIISTGSPGIKYMSEKTMMEIPMRMGTSKKRRRKTKDFT